MKSNLRKQKTRKSKRTLTHIRIGPEDDNCPLCQAARAGASGEEMKALLENPQVTLPPGVWAMVVKITT